MRRNGNGLSRDIISRAYNFGEIHRIREKVVPSDPDDHQVLLITSPDDNTGNSFLACVLALNTAHSTDKNVLLVDMNMRNPQLHIPFNVSNDKGFRDYASGSIGLSDIIQDNGYKRIKIITAGNNITTEAQDSRRFLEDFFTQLKQSFSLIIVDTSPLLIHNKNNVDPVLLSLIADKVILVIQNKESTQFQVQESLKSFPQISKVAGIVYNKKL